MSWIDFKKSFETNSGIANDKAMFLYIKLSQI